MSANPVNTTLVSRILATSFAACLALSALPQKAEAALVLQFDSAGVGINLINNGNGTSTFSDTPIAVSLNSYFDPTVESLVQSTGDLTITFDNVTSTTAASGTSGFFSQNFAGTIVFNSGSAGLLLRATFDDILVSVPELTGSTTTAMLFAAQPPQSLVYESDYEGNWPGGVFAQPRGFSISFSLVSAASLDGSTVSFTSDAFDGNFNAAVVPEPGTLAMGITGAGLLGFITLRRRIRR